MKQAMALSFHPMDEASAREILSWRYEPPYDIYNADPAEGETFVQSLLDPAYAYHAITDKHGQLVGYCCFGVDARVPGGDYACDANALDVGLGMRPDLTGQGYGRDFFAAIADFAQRTFGPQMLRVTVAAFNQRAIRVYEKVGFERVEEFQRNDDGIEFVILVRQSASPDSE